MLRKRARSTQKDQQMGHQVTSECGSESCLRSDLSGQRQKTNSFFNVTLPSLFVGLSPKCVSDCDSVRSPTSPLEFKLFSNMGTSSLWVPNPKPSDDSAGHEKSWGCSKVGLGSIVDSLDDDGNESNVPQKPIPSSNSKTILFGLQIRSKPPSSFPTYARCCEAPKSLPKNYPIFPHTKMMRPSNLQKGSSDVLFEIGENPLESDPFEKIQSFSLDSKRLGSQIYRLSVRNTDLGTRNSCLGSGTVQGGSSLSFNGGSPVAENKLTSDSVPIASGNEFSRSLTPSEIELSEDYTCVISHGPNPKTTHIFGDCVFECHPNGSDYRNKRDGTQNGMPCLEELASASQYPPTDFLSYCYFCKKKLDEGKDIYMYRGDKAFCSSECRMEEISFEEDKEKSIGQASTPNSENGGEVFEKSMFFAI